MKRMNVTQRAGLLARLAAAITLAGAATVSAQSPAPVKVAPASPQGYSVVLVLGDVQNASAGDNNVPAAARKALGDMKDFLPYKSYRLLDAQWILGSQRTISRLRGANEQEYELTLRGVLSAGGKLNVNFRLAEPGAVVGVKPAADAGRPDPQGLDFPFWGACGAEKALYESGSTGCACGPLLPAGVREWILIRVRARR